MEEILKIGREMISIGHQLVSELHEGVEANKRIAASLRKIENSNFLNQEFIFQDETEP